MLTGMLTAALSGSRDRAGEDVRGLGELVTDDVGVQACLGMLPGGEERVLRRAGQRPGQDLQHAFRGLHVDTATRVTEPSALPLTAPFVNVILLKFATGN